MTRNLGRIILLAGLVALLFSSVALAESPNLMAAFFVKGKVGLKWSKVSGASEYLVFRKAPGEDFVQVGTSAEDRWFDTDVAPGTTYIYKVAIVEGGQQVFSGQKSVSIPGDTGAFKAPSWVGIRLDQDQIFLNWDPVPGAVAYNIWRSETSGSGYETVGTSQGSRHVDNTNLVRGKTYYYVLTAMNQEFDETPQSSERSIKYGMSLEEREALEAEANAVELVPFPISLEFEITEGADGGKMNQPSDIGITSDGSIYLIDALNQQIHCYDAAGAYRFSFGDGLAAKSANMANGAFIYPFTMFVTKNDEIYVADIKRNDIQVFDKSGKFLRLIQVDTGADMEPLRANGLFVMDDGRLVMTDTGNHRFLVTDANGRILLAKGERGAEPGQFVFPDGLTVLDDGTICVVGPINCRVQMFTPDGELIRTFGSVGQGPGQFGRPKTITVGPKGNLWVADGMSHMLQSFTAEGEIQSILGSVDDKDKFMAPRGVVFSDGRLFVVQRLAHKAAVYGVGP